MQQELCNREVLDSSMIRSVKKKSIVGNGGLEISTLPFANTAIKEEFSKCSSLLRKLLSGRLTARPQPLQSLEQSPEEKKKKWEERMQEREIDIEWVVGGKKNVEGSVQLKNETIKQKGEGKC